MGYASAVSFLGPWDILIVAFVLLLIFGGKRLPQMGKSVGGSIRGFKDAVTNRVEAAGRGSRGRGGEAKAG